MSSDWETADVWCETTRTARKFYRCHEWSFGIRPTADPMHGIYPGQQYVEITYCVHGDGWQRERVCMDCMAVRKEFEQLAHYAPPVGHARSELEYLREQALYTLETLGHAGR